MTDKAINEFRFLPLCAVVRVKDHGEQLYAVVSRGVVKADGVFHSNYRLVKYPEGYGAEDVLVTISDDEVVDVILDGYPAEADEDILQAKITAAEQGLPAKPRKTAPSVDPKSIAQKVKTAVENDSDAQDLREKLRENPFYKFMDSKE